MNETKKVIVVGEEKQPDLSALRTKFKEPTTVLGDGRTIPISRRVFTLSQTSQPGIERSFSGDFYRRDESGQLTKLKKPSLSKRERAKLKRRIKNV